MTIDEIKELRENAAKTSKNLKRVVAASRAVPVSGLIKLSNQMMSLCDIIIKIDKIIKK